MFYYWIFNHNQFVQNKSSVFIFAFGAFNSKQANVDRIQHFLAQTKGLELHKENLNAANIYLSGINVNKYEDEAGAGFFLAPWSRSRSKKIQGAGAEASWEKNQEPEPLEKKVRSRSRKKICRLFLILNFKH